MKNFRHRLHQPSGQVFIAFLFFVFFYAAALSTLVRAGRFYLEKSRARRAADLTVLSAGAVYANGLQLVRYSNAVLLLSLVVDLIAISFTQGAHDPKLRKHIQRAQSLFFGVPLPGFSAFNLSFGSDGSMIGIYPTIFYAETMSLLRKNEIRIKTIIPVLTYNQETSSMVQRFLPHMALKFRTAADLLFPKSDDKKEENLYGFVEKKTNTLYVFTEEQVTHGTQSNGTPYTLPKRKDWEKHKFLKKLSADDLKDHDGPIVFAEGGGSLNDARKIGVEALKKKIAKVLSFARKLLEGIPLDVTHRDTPPNHTLVLYAPLEEKNGTYHLAAYCRLIGEGLAAWDIAKPPFRVRLEDPRDVLPKEWSPSTWLEKGKEQWKRLTRFFPGLFK